MYQNFKIVFEKSEGCAALQITRAHRGSKGPIRAHCALKTLRKLEVVLGLTFAKKGSLVLKGAHQGSP